MPNDTKECLMKEAARYKEAVINWFNYRVDFRNDPCFAFNIFQNCLSHYRQIKKDLKEYS